MKTFLFIILLVFASCTGIRTLEGRAKPVSFITDSTFSGDTLSPVHSISYSLLRGLEGDISETTELLQRGTTKAYIQRPTFFSKENYREVLLYPGERIRVNGYDGDYTFSTINGTPQRDRELQVIKTFHLLEKRPPHVPRPFEYKLQNILDFEKEQIAIIPKAEATSQAIFDSLLAANKVSNKFEVLTKDYVANRYDLNLSWLYRIYKDTLAAHGLYVEKIKQLGQSFNGITKKAAFNANIRQHLNEVHGLLFPHNMLWSMADEAMFRACFDSIEHTFDGLARDYLLSRAMHRAYAKGLHVSRAYEVKYKQYSIDKAYRKIVKKTKREQKRNKGKLRPLSNSLLAADGQTKMLLEDLLAQYKGKFVFIDLWASWCLPCLQEMPSFKKIMEVYSKDKVVFITLSVENDTVSWRRALYKYGMETGNHFLLKDAVKTAFYKSLQPKTIPRYVLINKKGKIIYSDAPSPSDPALGNLLNHLLLGK
ncbi:MAG TPA: TlpA disulfide reductase family protein [Flavisolibacter sp.]|nr:TlpA disulfide reductase family protein [Flavisolibacter sp.]